MSDTPRLQPITAQVVGFSPETIAHYYDHSSPAEKSALRHKRLQMLECPRCRRPLDYEPASKADGREETWACPEYCIDELFTRDQVGMGDDE